MKHKDYNPDPIESKKRKKPNNNKFDPARKNKKYYLKVNVNDHKNYL